MPFKKLHIEITNRVGFIFMGSGSRFNKLTVNTLKELKGAVAVLAAADDVGCIVITGHPGESFAVGADIGQMAKFGAPEAFRFAELGQSLFSAMEECPKPILGALNGITMGGGCDLAVACDIRLSSDVLKIAHPGAKLGIITGFCGTQKLPRLLGKNAAREVFMTSEPYDAAEALRLGLVDRVFPAATFWAETVKEAERIAANPPASLAFAKKLLNASEDVDLRTGCTMVSGPFAALCAATLRRDRLEDLVKENYDVFS